MRLGAEQEDLRKQSRYLGSGWGGATAFPRSENWDTTWGGPFRRPPLSRSEAERPVLLARGLGRFGHLLDGPADFGRVGAMLIKPKGCVFSGFAYGAVSESVAPGLLAADLE